MCRNNHKTRQNEKSGRSLESHGHIGTAGGWDLKKVPLESNRTGTVDKI